MKKFLLHIFFLALLCIALSNCRHDPDPEPEFCEYDSSVEEMKKWYYFKTGTWWVYEEATSGELDTVTVYNNEDNSPYSFEVYMHHSFDGYNVEYYFTSGHSIHCLTRRSCLCHKVLRSRFMPGDFAGESNIFLYPLIEGNYNNLTNLTGTQGATTTLLDVWSGFELNGIPYTLTVLWDVTIDSSQDDAHTQYILGKNSGILQRKIIDQNEVWSLIESNIIQ